MLFLLMSSMVSDGIRRPQCAFIPLAPPACRIWRTHKLLYDPASGSQLRSLVIMIGCELVRRVIAKYNSCYNIHQAHEECRIQHSHKRHGEPCFMDAPPELPREPSACPKQHCRGFRPFFFGGVKHFQAHCQLPSRCRAMTNRWIWLVPSPISHSFASRNIRSTG